jgi:hypothetical protein
MITQIKLFKLKDRSPEAVEVTRQVLVGMKGKIDVLKDIAVMADVLHDERSYDLAMVAKFNSLDDIQIYDVDPVHGEVRTHMMSVLDGKSVSVTFES